MRKSTGDFGDFRAGEFEQPVPGERTTLEQRSKFLSQVQPHRDKNLRVDPNRYTSKEEMDLERERLWPKVWLCAGRESDVPVVGAWFEFQFGDESIIIVRSKPDQLTALFNVCQHRGNQLVSGERGRVKNFVCRYHSWRYSLDGVNTHITDREQFRDEALGGFLNMKPLRCETWGGCVFVCMDDDAMPLREYLGPVTDLLEPYDLADMHIVQDVVVQLDCNWKTVLDAFSEAYHVHILHPQLMLGIEDKYLQCDFYPNGHSRQWVPIGTPSKRLGVHEITEVQGYLLSEAGLDPEQFRGRPGEVRAAIQQVKRQADNPWGLDYSKLSDSQLTDSWTMNIFPQLQLIAQPEGFLMQRYIPDPENPNKCRQHIMALAPKMSAGARPPAYLGAQNDSAQASRPARRYTSWDDPMLEEMIGLLLWQDVETTRACQKGMRSRGFEAVRFSEQETRNLHQFAELDRYLRPEEI